MTMPEPATAANTQTSLVELLAAATRLTGELLEAARAGSIVPARLPAQIEAIQQALHDARKAAAQPAPSSGLDQEEFLRTQAYFIGHAIHELRTPMTSIRGYADMLGSMGALNDMQKQFVDTIRTNSRRMEGLLTDVSDMNKLRAGTLRINRKMDLFKNIAMAVEKQMTPLAQQLERTLVMDIAQGLPLLETDGELLVKALNKFVENALRYQEPDDDHTVTVRATGEDNGVVVEIIDHGIGITPEDQAQLGTVYFRSEHELVRTYKGSGLGVPVAQGIITLLGGSTTFASTPGEGTTVRIRLPGMTSPT